MTTTLRDAVQITGDLDMLNASSVTYKAGSVADADVSATAAIGSSKVTHMVFLGSNFDLAIGSTVADREEIVYVCSNASGATIKEFHCTCNAGGSTGDSDFDVLVNGTTAMSGGAVNFDNSDADKLIKDGTLTTTSLSQDDIVSLKVTRNSSHDGTGPFAWVLIEEVGV